MSQQLKDLRKNLKEMERLQVSLDRVMGKMEGNSKDLNGVVRALQSAIIKKQKKINKLSEGLPQRPKPIPKPKQQKEGQ